MMSNKLHDFETKLFVELGLNSRSAKVLQNVIRRLPNKIRGNFYLNLDAQKKSLKILLDDRSTIDVLVKVLGG